MEEFIISKAIDIPAPAHGRCPQINFESIIVRFSLQHFRAILFTRFQSSRPHLRPSSASVSLPPSCVTGIRRFVLLLPIVSRKFALAKNAIHRAHLSNRVSLSEIFGKRYGMRAQQRRGNVNGWRLSHRPIEWVGERAVYSVKCKLWHCAERWCVSLPLALVFDNINNNGVCDLLDVHCEWNRVKYTFSL